MKRSNPTHRLRLTSEAAAVVEAQYRTGDYTMDELAALYGVKLRVVRRALHGAFGSQPERYIVAEAPHSLRA